VSLSGGVSVLKFIFLWWMAACLSCTTDVAIVRSLDLADSLMATRPDSALVLLQGMDRKKLVRTADKACLALLLSQAYDKNYIDIADDSLIRIAYRYYSRHGDVKRRATACYYLGRVQVNASRTEQAIHSFLEAIQYGEQVEDYAVLGLANTQLALIYEEQELFSKAIEYYDRARENFSLAGLTRHTLQSLARMGGTYQVDQQHGTALNYYRQARELALSINDTAYLANIAGCIGSVLYSQENTQAAKEILLNSYAQFNNGEVPALDTSYLLLGAIYAREGKTDSARFYFNRAYPHSTIPVEYELYKLESGAKNYQKACEHLYRYYRLMDSCYSANQQAALLEVEKRYKTTQLEFENYRHRTRQRYTLMGIAAGALLVGAAGLLLHRRHQRMIRRRDLQIREYLFALSEADNTMNSILDSKSEQERILKELLEKRFSELQQYYEIVSSYPTHSKEAQQKLNKVTYLASIEEETFFILKQVAAERYPGLTERLTGAYPELNAGDLDFLLLLLTGFSVQQMCAIYNTTSSQTIYTKKYRLTQKLGVPEGDTLDAFLRSYLPQ
jgi:tetratricopeptide (TPR) repeat protein